MVVRMNQADNKEKNIAPDCLERIFALLVVFMISISMLGLTTALMGHLKSEIVFVSSLLYFVLALFGGIISCL